MISTTHFLRQLSTPVKVEKGGYKKKQVTKWQNKRAVSISAIKLGLESGLTTIAQLAERIGMSLSYTKALLRELVEAGFVRKEGKDGTLCKYFLVECEEVADTND